VSQVETLDRAVAQPLDRTAQAGPNAARMLVLTGLSLSIGWGIRGNYGHEHGAMIAGALAAMAAVLLSGRDDWHRRIAYFGLFGALGWGFGGSISYMQVIGYTHSGHSPSVLYGFAMLFLVGFLWAAAGGAGTALPAFLSRERLAEFFVPGIVLFGVLVAQNFVYDPLNAWLAQSLRGTALTGNPAYRHDEPLYWLDTDWTSFLLSIAALGALALVRRRWDQASSMLLYMCVGWWVGFLLFPNLLGWRMTPPRGDSWAGCLGLVGGLWIYLQRNGLSGVKWASVAAGIVGGLGFCGAALFKLIAVKSGWETNWHSVLEQTYGLVNGLGIGIVMLFLARTAPDLDRVGAQAGPSDEPLCGTVRSDPAAVSRRPSSSAWTHIVAALCLLALIPWLNLRKNSEEWVKQKAMPETLYWLSTAAWYNIAWIAFAVLLLAVLLAVRRSPPAAVPSSWLGRAQWVYILFLWIMVIGNLERALPGFREQRLITEGVILLNAMLCTALALTWPVGGRGAPAAERSYCDLIRRTAAVGAGVAFAFVLMSWGTVRIIYGDRFAGHSGRHIRFGPDATAFEKPRTGQPHP
jgi:hypothetical protein